MSNQDLNIFPHLKVNVPSFLLKTYEILENDSLSDLISWNKEGTSFIVFNQSELSSKVLANYFKHKNYPSFLRQLNMYNFKKTRNQFGQSEFRHKWFRRGLKSMLQYIKRRNQEESDLRIETKESSQELDNYKREHDNIKQIVKDIQETQLTLQKDLNFQLERSMSLTRQNQNTLQAINLTQQQFNQKYDYVTIMLTNAINNLPSLLCNFREIIKYCQDDNRIAINGTQNFQYNQLHYYPQRSHSFYYYENDPKQYLYKKGNPLALTASTQNNYLSPQHNYSQQSSQQNSPYRIQNIQMSPFYLDQRNVDQINQIQNLYQGR
ncbi:unnamed protein product [Paramecium sonneborni]|uniref:HSF-type DNA-binding domain-containing protein n=1 Tax=Paramecium sonneborni TaxID=65129 RepID=A0A8S1RK85_9CILI|nr:unnamed protein product [Paramecium sonneborni]